MGRERKEEYSEKALSLGPKPHGVPGPNETTHGHLPSGDSSYSTKLNLAIINLGSGYQ